MPIVVNDVIRLSPGPKRRGLGTLTLAGLGCLLLAVSLVSSCENPGATTVKPSPPLLRAQWAVSSSQANAYSYFMGAGVDSSGNLYTAGVLGSNATYQFGSLGSITTLSNGNSNSVLVKYAPSGVPVWSVTTTSEQNDNQFLGLGVDAAGNSYVAGYARSNAYALSYGNGVNFTPTSSSPWELVFVKFDANGLAQWISAPTSGNTSVGFAAAADSFGNSYFAGIIEFGTSYTIGSSAGGSLGVAGTNASDYSNNNGVVVKYNAAGVPQWVQTPPSGGLATCYFGVATDPSGNCIASGWLSATSGAQEDFGNGQTATGGWQGATPQNALVVKYDSNGATQWARTTGTGAPGISVFSSVCTDGSGNVYAAGSITGPGTYGFGNGQSVTASTSGLNFVVVKYSASGTALWARTLASGPGVSQFNAIACDSSGNVAAAGTLTGTGAWDFGNGKTMTSVNAGTNVLIVRYDSSGTVTSAATVPANSDPSEFIGVAVDSRGTAYAVGEFSGSSPFSVSSSISVPISAPGNKNVLVVKYR